VAPAPIAIVGASLAGLRAAQAIRAAGEDGEVAVVGAEPHLPYTRPPLSKGVLQGVEEEHTTDLGGEALEVTWRLGVEATGLDADRRELQLAGGERLAYRRLIVATGSTPREWTGPGAGLDGVVTLRTLDDSLALRERFARGPRVVTVGAGFIGCEVAATACACGLEVTMVDIAPHPMPALGPELGAWAARLHRGHGVELRTGVGVDAIEGDGRVEAVRLADGTRLEADVAVIALGAVPEISWLEGSGLSLTTGVRCDATLTSVSHPDVLAAGDVCAWPHPLTEGEPLRVEHWNNAVEQGRLAGRNALLEPRERAPHETVPSMWSDQFGLRIQAVGLPHRADSTRVLEASPDGERLVLASERRGLLHAAVAVAAPRRLLWYRREIERWTPFEEVVAAVRADEGALGPAPEVVAS
jgi:3-phenylpropionate/trans-cinnamate dioxygenase ferredoxin reductase component